MKLSNAITVTDCFKFGGRHRLLAIGAHTVDRLRNGSPENQLIAISQMTLVTADAVFRQRAGSTAARLAIYLLLRLGFSRIQRSTPSLDPEANNHNGVANSNGNVNIRPNAGAIKDLQRELEKVICDRCEASLLGFLEKKFATMRMPDPPPEDGPEEATSKRKPR